MARNSESAGNWGLFHFGNPYFGGLCPYAGHCRLVIMRISNWSSCILVIWRMRHSVVFTHTLYIWLNISITMRIGHSDNWIFRAYVRSIWEFLRTNFAWSTAASKIKDENIIRYSIEETRYCHSREILHSCIWPLNSYIFWNSRVRMKT